MAKEDNTGKCVACAIQFSIFCWKHECLLCLASVCDKCAPKTLSGERQCLSCVKATAMMNIEEAISLAQKIPCLCAAAQLCSQSFDFSADANAGDGKKGGFFKKKNKTVKFTIRGSDYHAVCEFMRLPKGEASWDIVDCLFKRYVKSMGVRAVRDQIKAKPGSEVSVKNDSGGWGVVNETPLHTPTSHWSLSLYDKQGSPPPSNPAPNSSAAAVPSSSSSPPPSSSSSSSSSPPLSPRTIPQENKEGEENDKKQKKTKKRRKRVRRKMKTKNPHNPTEDFFDLSIVRLSPLPPPPVTILA
jgi:hypothetical protein